MTSTSNGPHDDVLLSAMRFMGLHATPMDWIDFLKVPLFIANRENDSAMAQRLLQACDQLCSKNDRRGPFSLLHLAAKQGDDSDMVELLVSLDERLVDSQDEEGWSALHHAARRGGCPDDPGLAGAPFLLSG